jgi:hypothetical protein
VVTFDPRRERVEHLGEADYPRLHLRLLFCPRDCWVGLYWVHDVPGWDGGWWESWTFYLCLLPMLPLRLIWDRSNRDTRARRRWHTAVQARR